MVKYAETMTEILKTVVWKQLKSVMNMDHRQPVSNLLVHRTQVATPLLWLVVRIFLSQ